MHVTKRTPFRSTMTSFPRLSVANILFLEVLALQLVEDNLKQYNNLTESNKIVTALVNFNKKHDTPTSSHKWIKVFKNGPSKICGRQSLKNFTWSIVEYLDPNYVS